MIDYSYLNLTVDGADVLIHGTASNFGGVGDAEDNGVGAWGFPIREHPEYCAVALPIRSRVAGLERSPLGYLPHGTVVKIASDESKRVVYAHLEDIGPAAHEQRVADLSTGTVHALNLSMARGLYAVHVRIIGGAKYAAKGQ